MYKKRLYRNSMLSKDLLSCNCTYFESDLQILSTVDVKKKALKALKEYHHQIKAYTDKSPDFKSSLELGSNFSQ